jgi:hypothetical protein
MSIPGNSGAVPYLGSTVGETLVDLRRARTALRKTLASRVHARAPAHLGREIGGMLYAAEAAKVFGEVASGAQLAAGTLCSVYASATARRAPIVSAAS